MANRVPLILNTSSNQIQELPTGDNLDLSNSGIHNAGVITATSFTGDGSALTGLTAAGTGAIGGLTVKDEGSVVGTAGSISSFDFRGSYITATANTGAAGVTTVTLSETPTFSTVTVTNNINANGRIVGAATSNVIPFLYSNYSDLPSAATYHGAFAHVHATQKAYYAHGGNWIELVNKDTNGNIVGDNSTNISGINDVIATSLYTSDSIIHRGETGDNTKIRFPADDTVTVETNGSERLRIDSSGRILFSDSNAITGGFGTHTWQPKTQILETQGFAIVRSAADVWGGALHLAKSRGSYSSPSAAASGDRAGAVYFHAYDGTDFKNYVGAIECFVSDTVASNDTPGYIRFLTTGDATNSPTERLRITSGGDVVVGGTAVGNVGSFGIQPNGHVRTVLTSGSGTGDTLFGAIGGVSNGFQINVDSSNNQNYYFHNGSARNVSITSGGFLLLGTTDTGFSSGYTNMTIGNTSTQNTGLTIASSASNGFSRLHFADGNSGSAKYAGWIAYDHAVDAIKFSTANSGSFKVSIDSSGKVDIRKGSGAVAPESITRTNSYLHLGGTEWGANAAGVYTLSFGYTNGTTGTHVPAYIGFKETTTSSYTRGDLVFGVKEGTSDVAPAEKLRILSNGSINFSNTTIATKNTAGDIIIDFGNLTSNAGNNWRKCGVWILYNGIDTDATDNKSVVYYTGVGAVTTWNWVGDSDTMSNDSFGSVTLQNAATTGFRLYCDVNNQNTGSVFVMIHGWNTKPTITIN